MHDLIEDGSGDLILVLRRELPFSPEGYRVVSGGIEVYGSGSKVHLDMTPEDLARLDESQIDFREYSPSGRGPVRETYLERVG